METMTGNGAVYPWGNEMYYAYSTDTLQYSYPLNIQFAIAYSYSSNGVTAMFGYRVNGGQFVWYDNATIHDQGVTSAYLLVDGHVMTPGNDYYDAELVFGGEGNGG